MAALQTLEAKFKAIGMNPVEIENSARGFLKKPEGMYLFGFYGRRYSLRITQNVCLTDEGPIVEPDQSKGPEIVA